MSEKPLGKIATGVRSQPAIISHAHASTAGFFTFTRCVIITVLVVTCFMAASREQSEGKCFSFLTPGLDR